MVGRGCGVQGSCMIWVGRGLLVTAVQWRSTVSLHGCGCCHHVLLLLLLLLMKMRRGVDTRGVSGRSVGTT